ncbi:MAG: hypothetical protein GC150_16705 [Rhizobiales bacterium]|nr:hypothetical protein [Hyphomicrobiales bacterium]
MREYRIYFALIYPICLAEALCARVCSLLRHVPAGHASAGTLLHDARVRAHAIVPFMMAR